MLSILHSKINSITPINGISINDDNSYRIDYINEPTQEQLDQINNLLISWPLEEAKINKTNNLNTEWEKVLSAGWITPYGWKLGLTTNDLVLLSGNFSLAKEAAANNINTPIFIIDSNGESHELSLQDLTILMLQYGQNRANLSSLYASKIKLINEASSFENLNNINITIL